MKRPVIQVDFSKNSIFKPILEYDYSSDIAYIEVKSITFIFLFNTSK